MKISNRTQKIVTILNLITSTAGLVYALHVDSAFFATVWTASISLSICTLVLMGLNRHLL